MVIGFSEKEEKNGDDPIVTTSSDWTKPKYKYLAIPGLFIIQYIHITL